MPCADPRMPLEAPGLLSCSRFAKENSKEEKHWLKVLPIFLSLSYNFR
jgi:hypothetical protein